jgi:hypothetical protein
MLTSLQRTPPQKTPPQKTPPVINSPEMNAADTDPLMNPIDVKEKRFVFKPEYLEKDGENHEDDDKIPAYVQRKCSTCFSLFHNRSNCTKEMECVICNDQVAMKNMLWCGGSMNIEITHYNLNPEYAQHLVCVWCATGNHGGYNVMLEKGSTILEHKNFIENIEKKEPSIPCSYPKCSMFCDMKILLPKFGKKTEEGIKMRAIIDTMKGMVIRKKVEDEIQATNLKNKSPGTSMTTNTPQTRADEIVAVHCPWGCGASMDMNADGCASLSCLICNQHMCILCHTGIKCMDHKQKWGVAVNSGNKEMLRMDKQCFRCSDACHAHIKTCSLLLPGEKGSYWPPDAAKQRVFRDFVKKRIHIAVQQLETIDLKMKFWQALQPEHKIGSLEDYFT